MSDIKKKIKSLPQEKQDFLAELGLSVIIWYLKNKSNLNTRVVGDLLKNLEKAVKMSGLEDENQ